jgi:hypothetical protein
MSQISGSKFGIFMNQLNIPLYLSQNHLLKHNFAINIIPICEVWGYHDSEDDVVLLGYDAV